jgi:hypothetical protein
MSSAEPQSGFRLIASLSEAEVVIARLLEIMDAMLAVVEQETALVRAGKLSAAARLAPSKTQLAQHYLTETQRLKAGDNFFRQARHHVLDALRARHDRLRTALGTNLTVLATARAVSEGVIRGVSDQLARKSMPETYCASGRPTAPQPCRAEPLMMSRKL